MARTLELFAMGNVTDGGYGEQGWYPAALVEDDGVGVGGVDVHFFSLGFSDPNGHGFVPGTGVSFTTTTTTRSPPGGTAGVVYIVFNIGTSGITTPMTFDLYANFELALASLTPTPGANCVLYYLPTFDGTNYADSSATLESHRIATWALTTTASAKRVGTVTPVLLPPLGGRFQLANNAGVALSTVAAGTSVKMIIANVNLNGCSSPRITLGIAHLGHSR